MNQALDLDVYGVCVDSIAQPEETARYLDLPDLRHGVKANLLSFVKGMNAEGG